MALKQLILSKQLGNKRNELVSLNTEFEELITRESELEKALEEAETDEEITTVEESSTELQEELDAKSSKITALEKEVENLEKQIEELNNKEKEKPTEEGEKRMKKHSVENLELRDGINAYIRAKGDVTSLDAETRAQFTTVEGGALIPEQLMATEVDTNEIFDFTKYVNVVKVNSGHGKYPTIKHSNGTMISVEELAKNPELAVPTFGESTFDIQTYRGYIPVSQEVIDDADYDVVGLIAREIELQEQRTKNQQVIQALKGMAPRTIRNLDAIKTMFNVDISKDYSNVKAIVSASLYNALDLMKDVEGRYLLQPNVTVGSGKTLFGKELVIVDDAVIGTKAGDMVGFFGDVKGAVTLFDRKKNTVKWVDHDVYGQMLAGFTRFDVTVTDQDAGFYVTFAPEVAGA